MSRNYSGLEHSVAYYAGRDSALVGLDPLGAALGVVGVPTAGRDGLINEDNMRNELKKSPAYQGLRVVGTAALLAGQYVTFPYGLIVTTVLANGAKAISRAVEKRRRK